MKARMAMLVAVVVLATLAAVAQETETAKPMSEAELIQLVQTKTPAEQIVAQIRARGIAFKPTPALEGTLKTLKAKPEIWQALTLPARVELEANVAGAEVLVDREKRGVMPAAGPLVLADFGPGSHVVRVQAEGYVGASAEVFLRPGETRRLKMELKEAVTAAPGPLGMRVNVQAGTPEDSALAELDFAKDTEARLALLQKFVERYQSSPVALLGYGLLQETYLSARRYDEALAAGEEVLRRDPRNFAARLRQVQACLGKRELEKAFDLAAQARQQVEELPAAPPPAETSTESWQQEKQRLLESAQSDLSGLAYTLFVAVSEVTEPARQVSLLERFNALFPQSEYKRQGYVLLALAYQQQGNAEKMLAWADEALKADPDQPTMLILVADVLSERRQGQAAPTAEDLKGYARARQLANHLSDLLTNQPEKVRPQGLSEEQWAPLKQSWEGIAHGALGQVLMQEEKTSEATKEFQAAVPLLKGQTLLYVRNLYRLGFAYAKLGELRSARDVLTEGAGFDTPYRQPIRELLAKVQAKLGGR